VEERERERERERESQRLLLVKLLKYKLYSFMRYISPILQKTKTKPAGGGERERERESEITCEVVEI
jgi:hypothetical protein